jgi:hypothetical protein
MKEVESVLAVQRRRVVAELKTLTKSSTAKELETAIGVWIKQSSPEGLAKVFGPPIREKAVLAACEELAITYGASAVKLFASLNRFRRLHGQYLYLSAMEEAHKKNLTLLVN